MIMKKLVAVLAAAALFAGAALPASAENTRSTSYTVTLTINDTEEVSQDSYLPTAMYLDLGISGAQDLYIADDIMYIADTGNQRVLAVDLETNAATVIGEGILKKPTGVAADEEGRIYVADSGNSLAYRFLADGTLDFTFERPTTPNYGEDEKYTPIKIAAAEGGGVYIISDGTQAGIIHMSGTGSFLGYFASNQVQRSLFDGLLDMILTEEQKSQLLQVTPASFENIFRGADGLVYTINRGSTSTLKKHSINGVDMLSSNENLPELSSLADLCVTPDGRMIVVDTSGYITEISFDGFLLCKFGGPSQGSEKIGLFSVPKGIGTDSESNIYVLDSDRNYIQVFTPTFVQKQIQTAIQMYNNGEYDESIEVLNDVMKYNNSSYFAHLYLGLNYMQKTEYATAQEHFRTANAKEQYSDAYWEFRNVWLQENMMYILMAIIIVIAVVFVLRLLNRKKKIFAGVGRVNAACKQNRLYFDMTKITYAFKHPIDNAYEIRKGHTGTYLSATILYAVAFLLIVLYQTASGFIFSVRARDFSLLNVLLLFVGALGLFLISNYFISSINDGEGTFRSVYIAVAYSLAPALLIMPFVILFANVATIDETYLINTVIGVVLLLCGINIFLSIIEVHQYNVRQTIVNILLTLFFMAVIIFAVSIVYLLVKQIFDFVSSIFVEVNLRV